MTKQPQFEKLIRTVTSILYRTILIAYSLFLMLVYTNALHIVLYISCLMAYGVISHFLILGKRKYQIRLRIILDYSIITLFLYSKPIEELICTVYLLLPIFNTPNFSGTKRNYFLLFAPIIAIYVYYTERPLGVYLAVPFLMIMAISLMEYLRTRANNFYYGLTDSITEFYASTHKVTNEYEIYKDLITRFNENKFSRLLQLDSIVNLLVHNKEFLVMNSSEFINKIDLADYPTFRKNVIKNDVFELDIQINGITTKCLVIPLRGAPEPQAYLMCGKKTGHFLNYMPYFRDEFVLKPFLQPFFQQLSEFFANESHFKRNRMAKFQKVSNEYEYVLKTINALHFIRNRLSPFNNYLEMTSDLYRDHTMSTEKRETLLGIVIAENTTSRGALKDILSRAQQILENGENPFDMVSKMRDFSTLFLLSELRNLLRESFGRINLVNDLSKKDMERNITIASWGMNIVFSDIIGNIKKHGTGEFIVTVKVENEKLFITFSNKFHNHPSNIDKLKELCRYTASEENSNIFKLSSKGAFMMKDFLKQMGVGHKVHFDQPTATMNTELMFNLITI